MNLAATCLSAFLVGLAGGAHCFGMCGGIISALSFAARERAYWLSLFYSAGRISSYALLGAIVASIASLGSAGPGLGIARLLAGALLVLMGLYLAGWWSGLLWLERVGAPLWRRLQPLAQRLLPVRHPAAAFGFGLIWGWLPCGLVYSALALSATAMEPAGGALIMLSFGLGTLPAVVFAGLFTQKLRPVLQGKRLRLLFALCLIGFGVWTAAAPLLHGFGGHAAGEETHHHPAASSTP